MIQDLRCHVKADKKRRSEKLALHQKFKRQMKLYDYKVMNGSSDTETKGSDIECQSPARRLKRLVIPSEISMAEESEDDSDHQPKNS
jgi:hypothetical protein